MKKHLFTIIKIGISVTIMIILFRGMDLNAFKETILSMDKRFFFASIAMLICIQFISILRWSIILKKDADIPYLKLMGIYLVGMFFNNFLPTIVGGDVIKGYYLYKASGKGGLAVASVFLDRYTGLGALMIIAFVAVVTGQSLLVGIGISSVLLFIIAGFFSASLVIWVDLLHRWAMNIMARIHFYGINEKIDKFYTVLMSYKSSPGIILKAFLCSFFVQGGVIVIYFMLGRGLGIDIPITYFFVFVPLATVISMLPLSLAGLGVREGVFVYTFTKVGVAQEEALGLSLLFFFVTVMVSLVGGVIYVRLGGKKEMEEGTKEAANS